MIRVNFLRGPISFPQSNCVARALITLSCSLIVLRPTQPGILLASGKRNGTKEMKTHKKNWPLIYPPVGNKATEKSESEFLLSFPSIASCQLGSFLLLDKAFPFLSGKILSRKTLGRRLKKISAKLVSFLFTVHTQSDLVQCSASPTKTSLCDFLQVYPFSHTHAELPQWIFSPGHAYTNDRTHPSCVLNYEQTFNASTFSLQSAFLSSFLLPCCCRANKKAIRQSDVRCGKTTSFPQFKYVCMYTFFYPFRRL